MEQIKKTAASEGGHTAESFAPRQMTLAENLILTVKILAIAGAVLAVIWGIKYLTSAQ